MPERESFPSCFGPYLRYAISTDFDYFKFVDEEKDFRLFLLVEFKTGETGEFVPERAGEFVIGMNSVLAEVSPSEPSSYLGPADDRTPYSSMLAPIMAVTVTSATTAEEWQRRAFALWEQYVSRVELSIPLKPSLLPRSIQPELDERWREGTISSAPLLIGLMDDGCPFAAAQFLKVLASSYPSTRVRAIWDQSSDRNPIPVTDGSGTRYFGQAPQDFTFGLEFRRDPAAASQIGLDEWMRLHLTPTGSIDEEGCYADAHFTRLAPQQSHGAHVMDVLAGRIPTSSRIGPSYPGGDRRDPPSWMPGNPATDPACDADVVFVQFSDDCISDATGVWLKTYVLAGIRYIMSFADPNVTRNVIINLSYGPTTGPHDGTAELEAGLIALVADYNGTPGKPRLDIFLAAGNSYLTEEHVVFTADNQHPQVEWTWRLLPDNTVLCFAEVWMDTADTTGVQVTLRAPDGSYPPVASPVVSGNNTMWRLEVGPTVAAPGIAAREHGDYTITVSGLGVGAKVHAYAARTDPNMGVTTGAKRSYFVDLNWERDRSAEASCTRVNGEFDKTGSLVSRLGTLNGIATEDDSRVHVAGGYVLFDGRKSPYSSAGPARSGSRTGPDYVLPCDESYALGGMPAGGTRSGVVFRLIGTSIAAPQLARQVAKTTFPQPILFPALPPEPERRGLGDLEPP
jgi:hypothetical protein